MFLKKFKKAFTLIEILVVIVIIWLLMSALLPKLATFINKPKDIKNAVSIRNYLIAEQAGTNSYPLHWKDFSARPYLVTIPDTSAGVKDVQTKMWKWSWIANVNADDIKTSWTEAATFITKYASKAMSEQDLKQLNFNDSTNVLVWFFKQLGSIYSSCNNNSCATLKNNGFKYIDSAKDGSNAKVVWGWFVLWLDKTATNGWIKLDPTTDKDIIDLNPELENGYVNFSFVNNNFYTLKDLFVSEEDKRDFVENFLNTIKSLNPDSITNLTAGN